MDVKMDINHHITINNDVILNNYSALQVRMGDHLQPGGGIEVPGSADVRGKMVALGGATPSDLRAKPSWFHDILTPYDAVALGHARSLGNLVAVGGPGQ